DGDTYPPDLGPGHLMIGVVAELRGQVERDRQGGLALAEQEVEAGVRLLRGPVPGELAHGPELAPVHGRVGPPGEWRLTGPPQAGGQARGPARHVIRRVNGGHRDSRVRADRRLWASH